MLVTKNKTIIIKGDLNIKFNSNESKTLEFIELLSSYNLHCCIKENTRLETCLDNIITDIPVEKYVTFTFDWGISDHRGVGMCFDVSRDTHNSVVSVMCRPITPAGLSTFHNLMSAVDWNFIRSDSDVEAKADLFTAILVENVEAAFPEKVRRRPRNLQYNVNWLNDDLRNMRDTLALMPEVYQRTKSIVLKQNIKTYRLRYKLEITNAKIKANDRYIRESENPSRASWQVVNNYRTKKLNSFSTSCLNPKDFNDFFVNIAQNLVSQAPTSVHPSYHYLFKQRHVNLPETRNIISSLKTSQAKIFTD